MAKKINECLWLVWKAPDTRIRYIIGKLTKTDSYEFSYLPDVNEAIKKGFGLVIPFNDLEKVYTNERLFPTFASRLPDSKRRGIEKILSKYGLNEFDDYELLKRSGGRLPIDTLEFIDPIPEDGDFERKFYIAGPRHYIGCEGKECDKSVNVVVSDTLDLEQEPTCPYDSNAIKILSKDRYMLGYIPRYFSKAICERIDRGYVYKCIVTNVNKNSNCNECIEVILKMCK